MLLSPPPPPAAALLLLLLTITSTATLFSDQPSQKPLQETLDDKNNNINHHHHQQWTLNFSCPAPHLFSSIPTLLHQWSNTIFPNGHALAAVEVPAYTTLYHGLIASAGETDPAPPSPEWLAFDAEMSYGIMGSSRHSFLLAYQTVRPTRLLYFDGESAALAGLGQMDTQMLQLFGNVSGPPAGGGGFIGLGQEYLRAHGLCDWLADQGLRGAGWGFEGVVRMNAGFEVIWCDFLSPSLRLVSRTNTTAPLLPDDDSDSDSDEHNPVPGTAPETDKLAARGDVSAGDASSLSSSSSYYYPLPPQPTKSDRTSEPTHAAPPPNMRWGGDGAREPFLRSQGWGWFDSATWHYGTSRNGPGQGETRARVLSCGILSYYSPRFANQTANRAVDERRSLNLTREGLWQGPGDDRGANRTRAIRQLARRRRYHHLGNVTNEEAMLMRANSERALRSLLRPEHACSGADWVLITSEITQRTADQLTMMDTKLAAFPAETNNNDDKAKAYNNWLFELRGQSHLWMVSFLEYPAKIDQSTWSTKSDLYKETHSRCKYRYTRLLVPDERHATLTPEEEDIRWAVEEVYGTICSVLLTMGFGIERAWTEMLADKRAAASDELMGLPSKAATWRDNIAELTAWLGWEGQYYGCSEQCAWDERCYIPMWPLVSMGRGPGRGRGGPGNGTRPGPGRGRGPPGGGGGGSHRPGDGFPPPPDGDGPGYGPGYGYPGKGPGFGMPPRSPSWMGDDTDLWEPKCVNVTFIMGER